LSKLILYNSKNVALSSLNFCDLWTTIVAHCRDEEGYGANKEVNLPNTIFLDDDDGAVLVR